MKSQICTHLSAALFFLIKCFPQGPYFFLIKCFPQGQCKLEFILGENFREFYLSKLVLK